MNEVYSYFFSKLCRIYVKLYIVLVLNYVTMYDILR